MDMEQVLQVFLAEARDLLEAMENGLLCLEATPDDEEAINAVFRAAHTIKGSAGLFGLDEIVAFTHVVENVLDRVRDREVTMDNDLAALLLRCRDHITRLLDMAEEGVRPDAETQAMGAELHAALQLYLAADAAPAGGVAVVAEPPLSQEPGAGGPVASDTWHISLRFGADVLRNGMDPLSFLRYLNHLGEVVYVTTLFDGLPPATQMEPESCYLGFEIELRSDADKESIANVFEFVQDDCLIRILPPHSRLGELIALLHELPESDHKVGELLVQSGALTRRELEQALALQQVSVGEQGARIGEILVEQGAVHHEVVNAALEKQRQGRDSKGRENCFIRIQADKLDQLINLVGELVTLGDGVNLHAQRLEDELLFESASVLTRLVSDIRDSALVLRMVPIGETFNRFRRVVRDVGQELQKDIALVINGAETELDKSVIEKIGDPLMHLLRNAMDHGIEAAEARRAQGKPGGGTVSLNAYHDSGSIVIEVADDGAGINTGRVRAKALERGLIQADQPLTQQEICNLVFEPGFSTAEQVTNLSGRGVGMDVVRRNIEALRGTVTMQSGEGAGTTARIRLPLTLAIIDAFQMGIGDSSYVVPLEAVVECVELDEPMRHEAHGNDYIQLRDDVLPLLRLRDIFAIRGKQPSLEYVVVVQFGNRRAGLVVDRLFGEFQAVIKPVAKLFGTLRGIGGTTILGSGEVALILDVAALVQRITVRDAAARAPVLAVQRAVSAG
ncbi:MAG: chemotaxis protein CheA [Gammaproteobacteria bacterium]|nr:chemotaxis protein CheA [Gammaproteobacteria bacterium]